MIRHNTIDDYIREKSNVSTKQLFAAASQKLSKSCVDSDFAFRINLKFKKIFQVSTETKKPTKNKMKAIQTDQNVKGYYINLNKISKWHLPKKSEYEPVNFVFKKDTKKINRKLKLQNGGISTKKSVKRSHTINEKLEDSENWSNLHHSSHIQDYKNLYKLKIAKTTRNKICRVYTNINSNVAAIYPKLDRIIKSKIKTSKLSNYNSSKNYIGKMLEHTQTPIKPQNFSQKSCIANIIPHRYPIKKIRPKSTNNIKTYQVHKKNINEIINTYASNYVI
ncbi:hypothetical protein A3Q56_00663 [Intoshia linei]|uniref:Uncharacterized protein n=1 Tax=Intoshia linei TaxID=1819745 RepID=A0A177BCT3_9BILA|nr:hypothetical protein A3Q56_00663 [Intoshia linei]